jgi:hypothetical protein
LSVYSQRPAKLSVRVDFPQVLITQWYPKAAALLPETLSGVGIASSGCRRHRIASQRLYDQSAPPKGALNSPDRRFHNKYPHALR